MVFTIGSRVRVSLNNKNTKCTTVKASRRGVIATLDTITTTTTTAVAMVLLDSEDDCYNNFVAMIRNNTNNNTQQQEHSRFSIVTPIFSSINQCSSLECGNDPNDNDRIETIVPVEKLLELFDFEMISENVQNQTTPSVVECKERGDILFKVHDFTAAASYYENVLYLTSRLQIGGTVLLRWDHGFVKTADVDCIEEDFVDVTMTDSEQEISIPSSKVLLCVWKDEARDHLQQRTLLNLTRCMLQLAEITHSNQRRIEYYRAAVLGSTLSLALSSLWNTTDTDSSKANPDAGLLLLQQSALLLRSQAQMVLQKFPQAQADLQTVLTNNPGHVQAQRQMDQLHRQKVKLQRTNKRLVKHVSQWVQNVMSSSQQEQPPQKDDESVSRNQHSSNGLLVCKEDKSNRNWWISTFTKACLILVAIVAWTVQKQKFMYYEK